MTVETFAPPAPYTISGTGPYEIGNGYDAGAILVRIDDGTDLIELAAGEYTVAPEADPTNGDVTLAASVAAEHAGKRLIIVRDTIVEQGWKGQVGAREVSLEQQIDLLARAAQDLRYRVLGVDPARAQTALQQAEEAAQAAVDAAASVTAAAAILTIVQSRTRNVMDFIPSPLHSGILDGSSVADVTAYLEDWLEVSANEERRAVGERGVFNVDGGLAPTVGSDHPFYEVECPERMRFQSTSNLSVPILNFFAADRDLYGLRWTGGTFLNGLGNFTQGAQSNTAFAMTRLIDSLVRDIRVIGSQDISSGSGAGKADAGITAVECKALDLVRPKVWGQADAGIYLGGGNDDASGSDDGFANRIHEPDVRWCSTGIVFKRNGAWFAVRGGSVEECIIGFLTTGAGVEPNLVRPGRQPTVDGTQFRRIFSRPVVLRGSSRQLLRALRIEDFGYNLHLDAGDPAYGVNSTPHAIRVEGAVAPQIEGGFIGMSGNGGWEKTSAHHGVHIENWDWDGDTYTAARTQVRGVDMYNLGTGIHEDAGVGAGIYGDNIYQGVDTPATITNAASTERRTNPSNGVVSFLRGGTIRLNVPDSI